MKVALSDNKNEVEVVEQLSKRTIERENASIRIQNIVRAFLARRAVLRRSRISWQRVFDPKFRIYFWYNRINGQTQWYVPKFLTIFNEEDDEATRLIQRIVRSYMGRMKARKAAHKKYKRYFDAGMNKFYWFDTKSNKTFWDATPWLIRQDIPMPSEDIMMHQSQQRIKELEEQLRQKELEIKTVRQKRYEELEPEVLVDRVVNAKALVRSKNMDEWTVDQLSAWFEEMKMGEHIPYLYQNRVDGLLFVNLQEPEWGDMGIVNRMYIRKLQIIMKSYRLRYQKKKELLDSRNGEEDELLSEYSPSELSDIIEAEGWGEDGPPGDDDEEESDEEEEEEEGSDDGLSAEQKLERDLDERNMFIETLVHGDGVNSPMMGDIVRVRYVCTLVASGEVVASSKSTMNLSSVEFALGYNQVIKGFDRAIPRMTLGERAKIFVTSEYGYGKEGLFPNIPADAELCFDITLLGFKARSVWIKPLIQEPGLSQKPYWEDIDKANKAFMTADDIFKTTIELPTAPGAKVVQKLEHAFY